MLARQSFQKKVIGALFQFCSSQHSNVTNTPIHKTDMGDTITVLNQCFHLNAPDDRSILQCYIFSVVIPVSQGHIISLLEQ